MAADDSNPIATRVVNGAALLSVLLAAAWLYTTPLRNPGSLLAYAQDDFYYYLVAARNLATGHGSTFDGTTLTNGYHPLYFVVWWAVCHFKPGPVGIFRFLAVLDTLSALAIFVTARAVLASRLKDAWFSNGLALATIALCYPKLQHQMEVTLTLPLVLLLLFLLDRAPEQISARRWLGIGTAASLMVLSRLDSVLLVVLFGIFAITASGYRKALTSAKALAFLAGFLPMLIAYVLVNEVYFHCLSPISGTAKQLKTALGFAWSALAPYPGTIHTFIVLLAALGLLLLYRARLTKEQRVVYSAALTFPFVHWLLELWKSDWNVWPWYTYSLRTAMLVVLLLAGLVLTQWLPTKLRRIAGVVVFAISMWLAVTRKFLPEPMMIDILQSAEGIRDFARTHPGRYAMGDRAGIVGYIDGQPTIQLEGLMMDGAFLGRVRRQEPLREVLNAYQIDYYVGFSPKLNPAWKPVTGCFEAREPAQAGPSSPTMRGEFCEPPAWTLTRRTGETLIFDLRSRSDLSGK